MILVLALVGVILALLGVIVWILNQLTHMFDGFGWP